MYKALYGLKDANTVFRGTLRYQVRAPSPGVRTHAARRCGPPLTQSLVERDRVGRGFAGRQGFSAVMRLLAHLGLFKEEAPPADAATWVRAPARAVCLGWCPGRSRTLTPAGILQTRHV